MMDNILMPTTGSLGPSKLFESMVHIGLPAKPLALSSIPWKAESHVCGK
jgi:hypothetical protein